MIWDHEAAGSSPVIRTRGYVGFRRLERSLCSGSITAPWLGEYLTIIYDRLSVHGRLT